MLDHIGNLPEVLEWGAHIGCVPSPMSDVPIGTWPEWASETDRLASAALAAADREVGRLKAIADSQAGVLRGLTEWAEALPEQARDIWRLS